MFLRDKSIACKCYIVLESDDYRNDFDNRYGIILTMENKCDSPNDFIFVDDLNISTNGNLPLPDTKEVLVSQIKSTNCKIDEIKEQLIQLSKRLSQLETERDSKVKQLSLFDKRYLEIELAKPSITKDSPLEEKLELLFALFHGRRDVFAVRSYNENTGKISYYPRCVNAWKSDECLLKRYKDRGNTGKRPTCMECPIRDYEKLTISEILNRQFRNRDDHGRNAIGIYPMLPDNTCNFVAIDLDEETWEDDALSIADSARRDSFQIAIERSFSGNGAHLWLFFSEPVSAFKARKLMFSFLEEACQKNKSVTLKSYDRVFPAQDRLGDGGLGNLILMPLVASAYMREEPKGTVFVDNNFSPYPDQIAFLSSLPRYNELDIDKQLLSSKDISGQCFWNTEDEADVIWRTRLAKVSPSDSLIIPLPIFLSSGISIPKVSLSAKLQDSLKRMACFPNPEYYRFQQRNKGYSSQSLSSFVQSYLESESVLELPRGLLSTLLSYLDKSGIRYDLKDVRVCDTGLIAKFNGILKPEQQSAFTKLLENETGILRAATSFGKTVVAAALIANRNEKTLILVPKQNLLDQWRNSLEKFLTVENEPVKRKGKRLNRTGIGLYGASKDSISGFVDVATFQTVSSRMPDFVREYGMVIVDECHYVAADSLLKVMQFVRPKYVYGLSATVKREDGLEKLIYSQCGRVLFEYNADKLAYRRGIKQIVVPRFTNYITNNIIGKSYNHNDALNELVNDENRNNLIVHDVIKLVENSRKVLVLTNRRVHAACLFDLIKNLGIEVVMMTGESSKSELDYAYACISDNRFDVIISTGKFIGEGTDIPCLDTLVLATPVAWEGVVSQYAGRIAREYSDKKETYIYDYVDICVPQLSKMYNKRLSTYRKLGYVVNAGILEETRGSRGEFTGKSFFAEDEIIEPIITAVRSARSQIVISSPWVYSSKITDSLASEIEEAVKRGVTVEIRTKTICSNMSVMQVNALRNFERIGANIKMNDNCYLKFCVFDSSELWFGDIDILGINPRSIDSSRVMIHVFSSASAKSLIDSKLFI